MIEIDPEDGLPVDLEAAVREANAERARQDAEDRVEFAPLYEGDWVTTAEALQTLIARGSTREEAAGSLLMWLQTNDGQAPHLRARAEQARRCFDGRRRYDSMISRDCIVHSWSWVEKVQFADWGGGSFILVDRATQTDQCRSELHLIGVTLSKDDLMARLSPSAVREDGQRREAEVGAHVPVAEGTTRSGDPGRPTLSRELYLQELQTRIAEGKITSMNGTAEIARELQSWIKAEHPTAPLPTTKTIENRIRGIVRTLKTPPK